MLIAEHALSELHAAWHGSCCCSMALTPLWLTSNNGDCCLAIDNILKNNNTGHRASRAGQGSCSGLDRSSSWGQHCAHLGWRVQGCDRQAPPQEGVRRWVCAGVAGHVPQLLQAFPGGRAEAPRPAGCWVLRSACIQVGFASFQCTQVSLHACLLCVAPGTANSMSCTSAPTVPYSMVCSSTPPHQRLTPPVACRTLDRVGFPLVSGSYHSTVHLHLGHLLSFYACRKP